MKTTLRSALPANEHGANNTEDARVISLAEAWRNDYGVPRDWTTDYTKQRMPKLNHARCCSAPPRCSPRYDVVAPHSQPRAGCLLADDAAPCRIFVSLTHLYFAGRDRPTSRFPSPQRATPRPVFDRDSANNTLYTPLPSIRLPRVPRPANSRRHHINIATHHPRHHVRIPRPRRLRCPAAQRRRLGLGLRRQSCSRIRQQWSASVRWLWRPPSPSGIRRSPCPSRLWRPSSPGIPRRSSSSRLWAAARLSRRSSSSSAVQPPAAPAEPVSSPEPTASARP